MEKLGETAELSYKIPGLQTKLKPRNYHIKILGLTIMPQCLVWFYGVGIIGLSNSASFTSYHQTTGLLRIISKDVK